MKENFRIIEDEELEAQDAQKTVPRAPRAQILRPAQITPTGLRTQEYARSDNPFDYELLIPVDGEVEEIDGPVPTLDFIEIEEDEVIDEDSRTTIQTPAYMPAQSRATG